MCSSTSGGHFLCLLATILILHVTISHGQGIESIIIDENTPTYISISWNVEAGSSWEYYTVDVVKASGKSVNRYPTNTTVLSQLITGLRPVEEYTITVTPWTSEGSGESLTVTVTTEAIAEGEILASKVTSSSAFIQWRIYETVFVYTVLYESSDVSKSLLGIFEPEVELPLPRPGTVFNVTVRGGNMDLASTQIRTEPEAPVNISLERIGTTEVTLSWTPPSTPHDAYEFYVVNNSINERSLFTIEQRGDVSDYEVTLSGLLHATVYSFEIGTVLNAKDSFELQRSDQNENPIVFGRTGPEAPLNIMVTDISNDSVIVTLTSPTSSHDAYELYLYNSTTNQKSLIVTIQREDDMKYSWTKSGLLPSTSYTVEGGTVLNAEGSFPIQRSEDNPMITFQTGDAVSPVLHYVLLLISLLAVFLE